MNKKIIAIAGLVFALIFVGIFLYIWGTTNSIMKNEAEQLNNMYMTKAAFNTSLFDGKVVSGQTLQNFMDDVVTSAYTKHYKVYECDGDSYSGGMQGGSELSIGTDEAELAKLYRVVLHYNINGAVDGLAVDPVN